MLPINRENGDVVKTQTPKSKTMTKTWNFKTKTNTKTQTFNTKTKTKTHDQELVQDN